MPVAMAVQVTIYLNESDKWQGRPLHMAILNYLHDENVFAACTMHAVAGFLGRQRVKTSHLVDAGGKLPIIMIFVDTDDHVSRVLRWRKFDSLLTKRASFGSRLLLRGADEKLRSAYTKIHKSLDPPDTRRSCVRACLGARASD